MSVKPIMTLAAAAAAFIAAAGTAAAAPAPKHPDFSGVWWTKGYQPTVKTVEGTLPPFQPWAEERYKASVAAQDSGKPMLDSSTLCLPHGMPRLMYAPYPFMILPQPDKITIVHEVNHLVRWIYMNEQHPKDLDLTYLGHSVGKWEGDTLVVDTVGLNDKTLIDRAGIPHTDQLHVIERFRLIDGGKQLEDVITIDDPKAFTKPWNMRITFERRDGLRLMEYVCAENNRNGG